jgi:chitinase
LSWNYNYGAFSKVLVDSTFDSHMHLLNNPEDVLSDSFKTFTAAFWFYMTPQTPKPSMHDVASGNFMPTSVDTNAGITNGFGVTTNIINGVQECGGGSENWKS